MDAPPPIATPPPLPEVKLLGTSLKAKDVHPLLALGSAGIVALVTGIIALAAKPGGLNKVSEALANSTPPALSYYGSYLFGRFAGAGIAGVLVALVIWLASGKSQGFWKWWLIACLAFQLLSLLGSMV